MVLSDDVEILEYQTLYVIVLFSKVSPPSDNIRSTTISRFLVAVLGKYHLVLVPIKSADLRRYFSGLSFYEWRITLGH